MKIVKVIIAALSLLYVMGCGTVDNTIISKNSSIKEVLNLLDSTQIKFIEYAKISNGDLNRTLDLTELWLSKNPKVKSVINLYDGIIDIVLNSGLKTSFVIEDIDEKGYSLNRGGEVKMDDKDYIQKIKEILSKNLIKNQKVLLYEADTKSLVLEPQILKTTELLKNSSIKFDLTVLRNEQCTPDVVETFKDYGIVILDCHGLKEAFQLGVDLPEKINTGDEATVNSQINNQLGNGSDTKIINGYITLAKAIKVNRINSDWVKSLSPYQSYRSFLSGKYINTLPEMPNTIIFGNMCYSGWLLSSYNISERKIKKADSSIEIIPARTIFVENPIGTAFINRKLISYYGYTRNDLKLRDGSIMPIGSSRPVPDEFASDKEDIFMKRLCVDLDSTKIAHLQSDNETEYVDLGPANSEIGPLYLRHYLADDYSYDQCGLTLKDERDGQVYKVVCIGNQQWMAENLKYNAPNSMIYNNLDSNVNIYGRIYYWKDLMAGSPASSKIPSGVQGLCPKGWHIPSRGEWDILINYLGGMSQAIGALKAVDRKWAQPNLNASNISRFSALPGGLMTNSPKNGIFYSGLSYWAVFHMSSETSSVATDGLLMFNNGNPLGEFRTFFSDQHLNDSKELVGLYCRCLKD